MLEWFLGILGALLGWLAVELLAEVIWAALSELPAFRPVRGFFGEIAAYARDQSWPAILAWFAYIVGSILAWPLLGSERESLAWLGFTIFVIGIVAPILLSKLRLQGRQDQLSLGTVHNKR